MGKKMEESDIPSFCIHCYHVPCQCREEAEV